MLVKLFFEFFKIGLFSVGGGMATLPFLYDLSARTGWFTAQMVADMVAVSESTPGPIGINMATYVGYTCAKIPGALLATVGIITPGIILVSVLALFLTKFSTNRYVNAAFYGLRPCSTALIAAAGLSVLSISVLNVGLYQVSGTLIDLFQWKAIVLAIVIWILTNRVRVTKKLHPVVYIVSSAVIGIVFRFGNV